MIADTPTLQLIAYSSLTLASVVVSVTSLVIGFRQNFGWKPILLYTGRDEMPYVKEILTLHTRFEVWNRRKYPINVRSAKITFAEGCLVYGHREYNYEGEWRVHDEFIVCDKNARLEANSHMEMESCAPLKTSLHPKNPDVLKIELTYFDPIKNEEITLAIPGRHKN
jgi:hypothetical protein